MSGRSGLLCGQQGETMTATTLTVVVRNAIRLLEYCSRIPEWKQWECEDPQGWSPKVALVTVSAAAARGR